MLKQEKFAVLLRNTFAKGALEVSKHGSNTCCSLWIYQPELPENVKKLRKF